MALDDRLNRLVQIEARIQAMHDDFLKGGDGGGTSGGMEPRIARLESDVDHIKKTLDRLDRGVEGVRNDVVSIKTDASAMKEQLRHLPSVAQMWLAAMSIVAALGGIVALAVRFIPPAS
ncbi:MAG: hypothetical protein ACKVOP_09015 [Sphingomonadaceae bacterium]